MAIKPDQLANEINKFLTTFDQDLNAKIKTETDRSMKQLVEETKATAPVGHRHRHYKDSITSRTQTNTYRSYIKEWYVKGSDYRLSHLLNNGHMLRDGGRYPGTQFITKASVSILADYERKIEEICNGK